MRSRAQRLSGVVRLGVVRLGVVRLAVVCLLFGLPSAAHALTVDFNSLAAGQAGPYSFVTAEGTVNVGAGPLVGNDNHLGVAAFDTNAGSSPDPDLLVGTGMALILQNNNFPAQTGGNFDSPNDDPQGGEIVFSFTTAAFLQSILLIDINGGGATTVTMTDVLNNTRTYAVPDDWTGDIDQSEVGLQVLDLTTLANQVGVGPGTPIATASEDVGFNPNGVVTLSVRFNGSAALDDLTFVAPEPALGLLIGFGLLGLAGLRRLR